MWAALHEHEDVVKLLLAKGANPELKSTSGKTALDMAKNPAIIELLKTANN
jgi:ankyrin repeat protein